MNHSYKSLALVDLSYLIARQYHARANDAGPNDAGEAVLGQLARIRESVDHVILCVDSPPYDRKKLYLEYKGTRKAEDPALTQIKSWIRTRVDADGYNVAAYVGQEGDDLCATLAKVYSSWCPDIRLVSADKDIAQCVRNEDVAHGTVTHQVRMLVPGKGGHLQLVDVVGVTQRLGVPPEYIPLFLALVGDKGDNIPGVDKVGKKKAAEMANAAFGDRVKLGALAVKRFDELGEKAPVWLRNLIAALPDLALWVDLTTLRTDVPVDAEKLLVKRAPVPLVEEDPFPLGDEPFPDAELDELASEPEEELGASAPEPARASRPYAIKPEDIRTIEHARVERSKAPEDVISKPPTWDEYNAKIDAAKRDPLNISLKKGNDALYEVDKSERAPETVPPKAKTDSFIPKAEYESPGKSGPDAGSKSTDGGGKTRPPSEKDVSSLKSQPIVVDRSEGPPKPRKAEEIDSAPLALRHESPSWALALQPSTAKEAMQIATVFFNSRYFSRYGTEKGIFTTIMLGRELGVPALTALQGTHIINDRPFLSANLMRALAERHPDCAWIMLVEADDQRAVARTEHRKAGKLEYIYTRERAEQAGYFTGGNKANWIGKTQEMLEARCISKAVRRWYPGAVMGMHSADEAEDFE